jgi:hypothetical protein
MNIPPDRDYELIGEDTDVDPAEYGVLPDDGQGTDTTEFGYGRGDLPDDEEPERP